MAIKKKGSHYWLDIRIKGKRIRRSLGTNEYSLAIEKAQDLQQKLKREYDSPSVRFSDFKKKYLEWAWSSKPASADREDQRLRKTQSFFDNLGIVHLDEITPYHIEQLRTKLKNDGLEKSTINRYLQLLRGLFYRAIDWEVYQKQNPLKKVKFYREESRVRALSKEDMARVIEAARSISLELGSPAQKAIYEIILLAVNTGLRKSELLNLRWRDIRDNEILVKGKGDKKRLVPLNQSAQEIIFKQPRRGEFIFDIPNRHLPHLFRRTTDRIKVITGLDFSLHDCRHFFATALLEKGVDLVTIAEILGHSRATISLIYSHTDPERKRRAVDLLKI